MKNIHSAVQHCFSFSSSVLALTLSLIFVSTQLSAADYPPNNDYGSLGDFIAKDGTEFGRTANLNMVGPLLVNLPEAPGSTSNGVTLDMRASVWDLTDLLNPTLIRPITCDGCFIGSPIFAHATVIRFDRGNGNDDAYLYTRNSDPDSVGGGGDHMTFNPEGLTSNDQAVSRELNWGFDPFSYPMLFSPYHLRRWWDYGDDPAGLQAIRDPSNMLPPGEPERWLGERFVEWDHLGITGVTGFSAWLGNLVVVASDQQSTGMAIYDISGFKSGSLPRLLSVYQPLLTEPDGNQVGIGGYWAEPYGANKMVWGARQHGSSPVRNYPAMFIVDFTDPQNPALTCELYFNQDPNVPTDGDDSSDPMYVNFQDQYAYVDHFRVDIPACEEAYDDQSISDVEFDQIVYRFNDTDNGCDGSQYFRPLGQVGIFGGYDWWVTQSIISFTGGSMPSGVYMQKQDGAGVNSVREIDEGTNVMNTADISVGDVITSASTAQTFTVTEVSVDERINEQGMCFMVTSDDADTNPPYVSGHRPLANQVNYPVDGFIHVHIPETLRSESLLNAVTVTEVDAGTDVSFRLQWAHTGTISIWPEADLELNKTYEVVLDGVQDYMGNTMARYSFRFSTGVEVIGVEVPDPDLPDEPAPSIGGTPFYPEQSSQLACEPEVDNGNVWVVNPDNDSITIIDRSIASGTLALTASVTREIKINYEHPTSVTKVNSLFAVTYRDDDKIVFFNAAGHPVRSVDSGHGSQPVASVSDGNLLYVSLFGSGEVVKVDSRDGQILHRLSLGESAKAMALHEGRLLITRFISSQEEGQVYDVDVGASDVDEMTLTRVITVNKITVADDLDHGSGVPNYLASIVINEDGTVAYIAATKSNIDSGAFNNGQDLDGDNTVRPIIITLDLVNNRDANTDASTRENAIDLDNAADPAGISFLPDAVSRVHTLQGNNLAAFNNLDANTTANISAGFGPQSMCTTLRTLYVKNFTGRTVSAIDTSAWMDNGGQNPTIQTISTVAEETLSAEELEGLKVFYHARTEDISPEGYISCASCHAGGGNDGMTWDITHLGEGLRNTISLNGSSGARFGDLHWSQNFDEVQDFEIQIEQLNGGIGLIPGVTFTPGLSPLVHTSAGLSDDLDALAAYVNGLGKGRVKRSPFRTYTGELSAAAQRGETVFVDEGCAGCHAGAAFRDGLAHDMGTITTASGGRLGVADGLTQIRTPTLIELWSSAPYFHNGTAVTLADVLNTGGHDNLLSGEDQADLIQYLLSIDRELYIDDGAAFP